MIFYAPCLCASGLHNLQVLYFFMCIFIFHHIRITHSLTEDSFEMWCFHMLIAQKALDPPHPLSNRHRGALFSVPISFIFFWHCQNDLKSAQTILVSVQTRPLKQEFAHLDVEKSAPNQPGNSVLRNKFPALIEPISVVACCR